MAQGLEGLGFRVYRAYMDIIKNINYRIRALRAALMHGRNLGINRVPLVLGNPNPKNKEKRGLLPVLIKADSGPGTCS